MGPEVLDEAVDPIEAISRLTDRDGGTECVAEYFVSERQGSLGGWGGDGAHEVDRASRCGNDVSPLSRRAHEHLERETRRWSLIVQALAPRRLAGCRGFEGPVPPPLWMSAFDGIASDW